MLQTSHNWQRHTDINTAIINFCDANHSLRGSRSTAYWPIHHPDPLPLQTFDPYTTASFIVFSIAFSPKDSWETLNAVGVKGHVQRQKCKKREMTSDTGVLFVRHLVTCLEALSTVCIFWKSADVLLLWWWWQSLQLLGNGDREGKTRACCFCDFTSCN